MSVRDLDEHFDDFTTAENEVLLLLADGLTDREISNERVISVHAVRARLPRAVN